MGDAVHEAGSTLVNIVRPNIAVKNGVIHLVRRPLGVQPESTFRFIEVSRAWSELGELTSVGRCMGAPFPPRECTVWTVSSPWSRGLSGAF